MQLRPPRNAGALPGMRYNSCHGEGMKRLRRIIFNSLTVLSLAFALFLIIWETFGHPPRHVSGFHSLGGGWWLPIYAGSDLFGFSFNTWTAASSVFPIAWLITTVIQRKRSKEAVQGLCIRCGYDLRATPTRCPECGKIPDTAKS
jgi:hypothetical protein